ncbi:MAG: hypothetical protein QNJ46_09280 [Leptolyngbyaceae cyanobacterium MO_188.B28]|nr:hypothetical protein [Leptolyngbyaceae cyanobacterium MO_188.B28]
MAESLTITNAPLEHPGMDYALLRQEGIKTIEKLAGNRWTDYNTHDPGVTILEALCYAITDLSYRLSFEIEDLLAYPASESDPSPLFFTPREILTVNPLTINDYRKLLIDLDGVKNAWLEPIETPQPELFYDANNAKLTFSSLDLAEPVHLRGLYRILLEPEPGYQKSNLEQAATARLHQHRNLCEDFADIQVLDFEEITVKAAIEIADEANPQAIIAQIHIALAQHISPSLPFLSLQTLLNQGKPVEEIFSGPILDHGFIDDQQLQQFDRKTELHTSDLIRIILDIAGVKTVRRISLASKQSPEQDWALDLDPHLTPRLKSIRALLEAKDITLYKGQIACSLDFNQAQPSILSILTSPPQHVVPATAQDLAIPTGDYRELAEYESIQNEFPLNYGIGDIGLPASASDKRKAQAKQLQAYLMVFDQLLANFFAQLDHVRDLFCPSNAQVKTYFAQSLTHLPGGDRILQSAYEQHLKSLQESDAVALDRKNRLLEHLIAQYGETFTNYSLLYPNSNLSDTVLKCKADFAKDYRRISAGRSQAFNYTLDPNQLENFQNVSGLKRRVARLLGMEPTRQFLASADIEGFYLIEHILLRPRQVIPVDSSNEEASADFLSFSHSIAEFSASDSPGHTTCASPDHGLKSGDPINIFYSTYYSGSYQVMNPQVDTFDIAHEFVENDTGEWVSSNQFPDPFSFQISVIFPNWPSRFQSQNFKQLIYDTLIAETPAHITVHFHWLDRDKMREFETLYALWLQNLSGNVSDRTETDVSTTRLINFLKLGSSNIPEFPALIGYMVIGESFVVN